MIVRIDRSRSLEAFARDLYTVAEDPRVKSIMILAGDALRLGAESLVDCISRACFLGEIANSGRNDLEFYDKTSVVGVLVDPCSR